MKFHTEEGNWNLAGDNTPVFLFRDPLRFPDLNHAIKRDRAAGQPPLVPRLHGTK